MDTGNVSGAVSDHWCAGLSGAATASNVAHRGQPQVLSRSLSSIQHYPFSCPMAMPCSMPGSSCWRAVLPVTTLCAGGLASVPSPCSHLLLL